MQVIKKYRIRDCRVEIIGHEKVCLDCKEVLPDVDLHASNLKKAWEAYEKIAGPQKRRCLGIIKEEE